MNFVAMGECMVEFSQCGLGVYRQSFAGDVYNTAVYLKRLQQQAKIALLSGIGTDSLSEDLIRRFETEGIETSLLQHSEQRILGAYLIKISSEGERSFVYWRDNSAAKYTMSSLTDIDRNTLLNSCTVFYFSGISLAIMTPDDRVLFWQLLTDLKQANAQIVFDSNYRSRLWHSAQDAVELFTLAYQASDVVFAGVEDFELLYDISSYQAIASYLEPHDISELIIKNGSDDVMCIHDAGSSVVKVNAVENVVDSTSAGDSFNAGYIHGRAMNQSMTESVELACKVSALVISHQGAIVDKEIFADFVIACQIPRCHQ